MNTKSKNELLELDSIPNLSYFPVAISAKVRQLLAGISGIEVEEDELAIYALAKRGEPKGKQIIIDTHLDHPGFVVDREGRAVEIGSIHNSMVYPIATADKQPVSFFSREGNKLDDGYLDDFKVDGRMTAKVSTRSGMKMPINTQVLPNVTVSADGNFLRMRSVDNIATVQICLDLLRALKNEPDLNLLVIFNKIEEVAQITATGIALRGSTPFGSLDKESPIFVLEAVPMFKETKNKVILGLTRTENGILFERQRGENAAMETVRKFAKKMRIGIMEADLSSNTDGISYLLIGGFNNVATLHINSQNRHNVDVDGRFAPEITTIKSVETLLELILTIIRGIQQDSFSSGSQERALNKQEKLKCRNLVSAYYWAQPRLKQKHLYPETLLEKIACALGSLKSRFWLYP